MMTSFAIRLSLLKLSIVEFLTDRVCPPSVWQMCVSGHIHLKSASMWRWWDHLMEVPRSTAGGQLGDADFRADCWLCVRAGLETWPSRSYYLPVRCSIDTPRLKPKIMFLCFQSKFNKPVRLTCSSWKFLGFEFITNDVLFMRDVRKWVLNGASALLHNSGWRSYCSIKWFKEISL